MSLAQLLADVAHAVDELQEQAQCADQVASQVDAALQQAHRSLGYSLQETAAQCDPARRPRHHLKASAAARSVAGVPAEVTAERRGPAGGATRRCRAKAHRKHRHKGQHGPSINQMASMQPPQQQPSQQQRQRHAGAKRKQPEPRIRQQPADQHPQAPLQAPPAAAAANGNCASQDDGFTTGWAQSCGAADVAAGRSSQLADAAIRSGGSGSSQESDVEMVDAQEVAASAPTLQRCTPAASAQPQPLQRRSSTDARADRQQQNMGQLGGAGHEAAAAAPKAPAAANTSREAPGSLPPVAAQRAGTAAGALASEVIVLSSSSDGDDDNEAGLPAGLTRSKDRVRSEYRTPSPGVAAIRRSAAAAFHAKTEQFAGQPASSPHADAAMHDPASSPLRAYSSGRVPPMLPAVMQDPHASGWTLHQPQSSAPQQQSTAHRQQQQQQKPPLTKASIAQRHQHTAARPVGFQEVQAPPSPPQRQRPTAVHPPAHQQQPLKAEAPEAQPAAQRHAKPPSVHSPGQPLHQPPQHPMPPGSLPDDLLPRSTPADASTAEQPPSDQPHRARKAPPPTMPAIPAFTPQPAQAPTAQEQSAQQWLAQRRRKRRVQLDDLLAEAQPALQQQQQTCQCPAAVRENAFVAPSPDHGSDQQQRRVAGTASAAAAAAACGRAAHSAAAAHPAPPSGVAQRPASAQSAKQGATQHHQQPGGMPAATSGRATAAAPAASQHPSAPSWQPPLQPAPTAQQRQQQWPPREPAATPHLGATAAAAPGGGGTESDPVTLSSDSDADGASQSDFLQPSSAASRHTGAGTAAASAATQRTLSSLFRFMAEHPPVPQRRRQQRPQPAAQQRPGGPHNTSPGGTGSGVADASWPARKAVAAKPAWRSTAGAGVAARTAAPTAAPAQQPQPQPQQSRAAQPAQPDDAAAPEASAPQPATDAAAPAPVTTADPPVVQQPPAVATAPARAPWATGMALSAAGAAGAAAAATGAAAASALNGDDGAAYDQAVELDRQAAWAGPEARAADAAEWEARQAVIAVQAENARRLKLQRRNAAEAERRAQERLEGHRKEADAREMLSREREALRGPLATQIQARVLGCTTLPQVLRALRQPIDGEPHPTPEQFLKAQKKALIKFHPDRYQSASVAVQVEAEEIFKVISKVPLTDPKPAHTWVPRRW